MKDAVAGRAKIKASGGIRDLAATLALLDAGADRIGTSAGIKILEEAAERRRATARAAG
jgi:deoxyribose-phosphate aldolase